MPGESRTLEIVAQVKDFATKTLGNIGKAFASLGKGAVNALRGIGRAITSAQGILVGFLGFLGAKGIKSLVDWSASLHRTARAIGTTTEALSTMQFVLRSSGLDQSRAADAIKKLVQAAGEASLQRGEKRNVFAQLGISVLELRNLDPVSLFRELADGLQRYGTQAERVALLQKIFGDAVAADLLPLLQDGPEAFAELSEEAKKYGAVVSGDVARKSQDFLSALEKIRTFVEGKILTAITPALEGLARWFDENADEIAAWLEQVVASITSLGRGIAWVLQQLRDASARESAFLSFGAKPVEPTAPVPFRRYAAGGDGGGGEVVTDEAFLTRLLRLQDFVEGINNGLTQLQNKWTDMKSAATSAITHITDNALNGMADALTDIILRVKSAKEAFQDLAKALLRDLVRIIINLLIVKALQSLTGLGGGGSTAAPAGGTAAADGAVVRGKLLGVGPRGQAPFRKFAQGGVAYGPTLALFGEGSSTGEAFVPLKGGKIPVAINGGGGGVVVNFNVQAIDAKSFRERMAEERAVIVGVVRDATSRSPAFRSDVRSIA